MCSTLLYSTLLYYNVRSAYSLYHKDSNMFSSLNKVQPSSIE